LASSTTKQVLSLLRVSAMNPANGQTADAVIGLDTMCTDCFVSKKLVTKLKLPVRTLGSDFICKGLDGQTLKTWCTVHLVLTKGYHHIAVDVFVVATIGQNLQFLPQPVFWRALRHNSLAHRLKSVEMDVLISASHTWNLVRSVTTVEFEGKKRALIETALGRCCTGEFMATPGQPVVLLANCELERAFTRFHSLKTVGISCGPDDDRKAEEVEAERQLRAKAHLVMPLLFKPEAKCLRNNVAVATRRLQSMERKLFRDPKLKELYNTELKALFDRGDARLLRKEDIPSDIAFYMPHQPVVWMDKESSKVRPGFDASATNSDGISLNSELLQTPVLHPPLTGILLRFRRWKIALTGDVSKMFLQMQLFPDHENSRGFCGGTPPPTRSSMQS